MNELKSVLEVDNVGKMSKTGAKCVLKGNPLYNGVELKVGVTVACSDPGVFDELGIGFEHARIEMVLQEGAQTTLPDEDEDV